jgi:peptidoglycan hydrolase CwlO-like protein
MEGSLEAILQYLDNFTPEFLIIETALLVIIAAVFVITWIFNRKKYHNYEHQIPAGVMKSYLDSIIQNSVSLKSSLFRGGGLENIEATAQVLPLERMRGGDSVAEANPADQETINRLRKELDGKTKEAKQLASQVNDGEQANQTLRAKIKELEDKLKNASSGAAPAAAAPSSGGDDSALRKELADVTKERDELKARLKEYEIIEDDLANLKRLQQENEQLKKALGGGGAAPAAAAAPAPKAEPVAPKQEEAAPAAPAASAAPASAADDGAKSPEDLLSEFEKMLG